LGLVSKHTTRQRKRLTKVTTPVQSTPPDEFKAQASVFIQQWTCRHITIEKLNRKPSLTH